MNDGNLAIPNRLADILEDRMNEMIEWKMYKIFARLHPIEAYDLRNKDFCMFMREEGHNMTDEQIKELIDISR
jgi:hypothetical protein